MATRKPQKTGGKSLPPEENEAMRRIVRDIVARDFKGVATAAADRWGVTQAYVSEFLANKRGAGMKLISAVSSYAGLSVEQLLGRAPLAVATYLEPVDRYANRVEAARFARTAGLPEEAIGVVNSVELKSDTDLSPLDWLDMIKAEAARLKFTAKDPAAAARTLTVREAARNDLATEMERRRREAEQEEEQE